MFTYRLHLEDASDAGEASYAQQIHVGDEIIVAGNRHFRVLDVVTFDDESRFTGSLRVEAVRT